jgi:hypothetical protein
MPCRTVPTRVPVAPCTCMSKLNTVESIEISDTLLDKSVKFEEKTFYKTFKKDQNKLYNSFGLAHSNLLTMPLLRLRAHSRILWKKSGCKDACLDRIKTEIGAVGDGAE